MEKEKMGEDEMSWRVKVMDWKVMEGQRNRSPEEVEEEKKMGCEELEEKKKIS